MYYKKIAYFLIIFVILTINVNAATREEMYKYIPKYFVDNFTEEEYKIYSNLNYDDSIVKKEYLYETKTLYEDAYQTYIQTPYKLLYMSAVKLDSTHYSIFLMNRWLKNPSVRSFDVIAFRVYDFEMLDGTQHGAQTYRIKSTGETKAINYSYLGRNMNYQAPKGFGISMNLVNDEIDQLENYLDMNVKITGNFPEIYGTYQHSRANIALSTSQRYDIGPNGYGNVLQFHNNIGGYYDKMQGVRILFNQNMNE